ncbi:serine/threonine protein kinase [Nitzschia inconspicua]|uniref:Cyclin-dependent kinase 2 homolog n=1 Tax=Nitzschia inconspicua TaxID=303405 RepID=A0A9K3LEI1_9STRA|nr:serine/threonine protein kinase [Nitzschia inconspicua]
MEDQSRQSMGESHQGSQNPASPPRMQQSIDGEVPSPPHPQEHNWWKMTRTLWHYEKMEQIGEGTYGQVYKARSKDTGQIVALKKIRVHHAGYWGMPPTVIREIKILKRLRHPNLVQMIEVVSSKGVEYLDEDDPPAASRDENGDGDCDGDESRQISKQQSLNQSGDGKAKSKKDRTVDAREGYKGNLFLVLEYVSHDLTGLMDVAYKFSEVQVKSIFKQLLEALQYMHDCKYIHRDIKSSNILIDHNFRVKLADFGLARSIEPPILDKIHDRGSAQELTNKVITLWYRPPELLLGATQYGTSVDIWSAGCILAELILGRPLFPGKSDMDQLQLIFDTMGTPAKETWTAFSQLKLLRTGEVTIEKAKRPKLRERYQHKIGPLEMGLIEKLLELDPRKRLSADIALKSRYFLTEPIAPDRPEDLGAINVEGGHFHEFQTKKKRREAKAAAEKIRQTALDGGHTEKEAQEFFDSTYREIMERVAQEGLDVTTEAKSSAAGAGKNGASSKKENDILGSDFSSKDKDDQREDRNRRSREKDRDTESRRERRDKREEKDRRSRDRSKERDRRSRDRDRDRKSRRVESEDRRKRKRRDSEERRREKERKKSTRKSGDVHSPISSEER